MITSRSAHNYHLGELFFSSGTAPFHADNNAELFEQIMSGDYYFHKQTWEGVSKEAKDLVTQCLTVDPAKRITATNALKHPWFKSDLRSRLHRLETHDRLTQWNLKRKVGNHDVLLKSRIVHLRENTKIIPIFSNKTSWSAINSPIFPASLPRTKAPPLPPDLTFPISLKCM